MARYKTASFQRAYDTMLTLAPDRKSELYYEEKPRRGASHRCAFWDGYMGLKSPMNVPGTLTAVCYQAGKAFKKIDPSISDATYNGVENARR